MYYNVQDRRDEVRANRSRRPTRRPPAKAPAIIPAGRAVAPPSPPFPLADVVSVNASVPNSDTKQKTVSKQGEA